LPKQPQTQGSKTGFSCGSIPSQEGKIEISKENLELVDPVQQVTPRLHGNCPFWQKDNAFYYKIATSEFPTVPSFIEFLEFNNLVLSIPEDAPERIGLVHEMAFPTGAYLLAPFKQGRSPVKTCNHPNSKKGDNDPVCIFSLWQLSTDIDIKGHRVQYSNMEKTEAIIYTRHCIYKTTAATISATMKGYRHGVFAFASKESHETA
jgi:hypothetical protein